MIGGAAFASVFTIFLQVNRWVDASFTDLTGGSSFFSGKRKDGQARGSKAEPHGCKRPRKRKGEARSVEIQASRSSLMLKEPAQRDQDDPWVDRYSPRSQVSTMLLPFVLFQA